MIDWNILVSQIATVAFDIVYFGAIISTIVVIILDNRNPVKTMAWILILLFLPIVGLVFYFFFGRSQRRERIIGQKSYDRLLKKPMAEYIARICSNDTSSVIPCSLQSSSCTIFQNGFPDFSSNSHNSCNDPYMKCSYFLMINSTLPQDCNMSLLICPLTAPAMQAILLALPDRTL